MVFFTLRRALIPYSLRKPPGDADHVRYLHGHRDATCRRWQRRMALLQLALARTREFDADLEAAQLTGDPAGLASALAKLEYYHHGGFERLFLPSRRLPEPSLLRTHPPTAGRIERLRALAGDRGLQRHTPLPTAARRVPVTVPPLAWA